VSIRRQQAMEKLAQSLNNRFETRKYSTTKATVASVTRDQYGRSITADLTVNGVPGNIVDTYGIDIGKGSNIEVVNVGSEGAARWRIANILPGSSIDTPAIAGSFYAGIDLLDLPGIRVRSDGYIVLGGDIDSENGVDMVLSGNRIEERKTGILGYDIGEKLAFGLLAGDYTVSEDGTDHQFHAGDAILGRFADGHLFVESLTGRLSWNVGDEVLFDSKMENGQPLTLMRGLLRVAEHAVGEGIEIGKQPGTGASILQLLNKQGVPLVVLRAGFESDEDAGYAQIGPPDPYPHITIRSNGGVPVIDMHGGIISNSTISAEKLNIQELSLISPDLGVENYGRMEFLKPGTIFHGWHDWYTATGLVIGYNDLDNIGQLLGLEDGRLQAYFGSDGRLYAGSGDVILDEDGIQVNMSSLNTRLIVVRGDGASPVMINECYSSDLNILPSYIGKRAGGSQALPTKALAGMQLAMVGGSGYFEGASPNFTASPVGGLIVYAAEDYTDGAHIGSRVKIYTTPNADARKMNHMMIDQDGTIVFYGATDDEGNELTTFTVGPTGALTAVGALAMGANKITGLADPTADQDAVTKKFLSTYYLPLTGGTLTNSLTLEKDSTSLVVGMDVYSDTSTNLAIFRGRRAGGTKASPSKLLSGTPITGFQSFGYYAGTPGAFTSVSKGGIASYAAQDWDSSTKQGVYLSLFTTAINASTAGERVRITDVGWVGILDIAPGEVLDVNGNIDCTGVIKVDDVQVVSNRVVDARCDDTINTSTWDSTTAGVLDSLRDAMITHGLLSAS